MATKYNEILDLESQNKKNNSKRNSCLLITVASITLLLILGYWATKKVEKTFQLLNENLVTENKTSMEANESLKNSLLNTAEYEALIKEIEALSISFNSLIDSTIDQLVIQTGGWTKENNKTGMAGSKNHETATRILIEEKVGEKLEQAILHTSSEYNRILQEELAADSIVIPLKLDLDFAGKHNKTWSEKNFDHLPMFVVIPLLSKFKVDESESKAILYRQMANR